MSTLAEVRVVNDQGADVPPGTVGEFICRSPATMLGYYGMPGASADTLVDGWLHTGDLAHVDDEGFVYVSGRSKDMIITGGLNVYPAEVERVLAQHPAVLKRQRSAGPIRSGARSATRWWCCILARHSATRSCCPT